MRLLPARFRDELHDMHSVCFKEFALLRPEHRGQSVDRRPCGSGVASRGRVRDPRDEEQEVLRSLPGGTAVVETLSHAEFSQRGHVPHSCFFADLAPRGGLQRFAGLDVALGRHIRFVLAFADESYEDVAVVQAHHHATGSNVLGDAIRSFIPARVDAHVHRSPFPVRCWEGPLPGDENSLDAMPLLLREEDVARVLQMDRVIAAVEEAFRLLGSEKAINRPRRRSTTAGTTLQVMSAAIPPFHVMGLKAYTSARGATPLMALISSSQPPRRKIRCCGVNGCGRASTSMPSDRTGRTNVNSTRRRFAAATALPSTTCSRPGRSAAISSPRSTRGRWRGSGSPNLLRS